MHSSLVPFLLVAILGVLVLAERLIGPPEADLQLLALLLASSGVGSLLVGALLLWIAGARLGSLWLRVTIASAVGLLVALVNVLTTSALMVLNTHDLTLLVLLLAFTDAVSLAFAFAVAGGLSSELERLARTAARLARVT